MLQWEHSAILLTLIKLPFPLRPLFCLYLSGHFTQVLLYSKTCVKLPLSKTCVKLPLSKTPKLVFKTNYRLMQVKSIAECSKGFQPSLSYHFPLRPFFCLFLSGCFYSGFTVLHRFYCIVSFYTMIIISQSVSLVTSSDVAI